jgi:Ni,Fe-hydrogenase I cytochrome b subunit
MDRGLKDHIERLETLGRQLRLTGLLSLGLTVGNLLVLALLFTIFFFNQRLFKNPSSFSAQVLQTNLGIIFFVSCVLFVFCLVILYWFDHTKKTVHAITDEIFDELNWYSKEGDRQKTKLTLDERIALKSVSQNSNLPFLSESQSVAVYVIINFMLFLAVAAVDLYLIQSLNVQPS